MDKLPHHRKHSADTHFLNYTHLYLITTGLTIHDRTPSRSGIWHKVMNTCVK